MNQPLIISKGSLVYSISEIQGGHAEIQVPGGCKFQWLKGGYLINSKLKPGMNRETLEYLLHKELCYKPKQNADGMLIIEPSEHVEFVYYDIRQTIDPCERFGSDHLKKYINTFFDHLHGPIDYDATLE